MNCKNCGEFVKGKFCSQCGQAANVKKVNFENFANEISESVLIVNKGFFYTLTQLFKNPGKSIREYLDGKRKKHFKPFTYVLLLSTIYFFISSITGLNTWVNDFFVGFLPDSIDENAKVEIPPLLKWFSENLAYTNLLLLPIFSLTSFIAFRRYKRNYLEHIILNAYLAGQQTIFYAIFLFISLFIQAEFLDIIPSLISFFYITWAFYQFFSKGNFVTHLLRTLLAYMLYLIGISGMLFVYLELYN